MKHIKLYEKYNKSPKLGDYVICYESELDRDDDEDDKRCKDFLSKNIGIIVKVDYKKGSSNFDYLVQYFNIPENLYIYFKFKETLKGCRAMYKNEIVEWSKDKEDMEAILNAKKYNL